MTEADTGTMKPIVARDQVRLGATRCLQLALSGMSYRMFRSGITVAILALAVAFVAHMLSFGLIEQEAQQSAYSELKRSRRLGQDITRLTTPDSTAAVLRALAESDPSRLAEYARWASKTPSRLQEAASTARQLRKAEAYFEALAVAARAVIVGDRTSTEQFDRLATAEHFARFEQQAKDLALQQPPGGMGGLRRLIEEQRPRLLELVEVIRSAHGAAIEALKARFDGQAPGSLVADPPAGFGAALAELGFALDGGRLQAMTRFAREEQELRAITRALLDADVAAAVIRETGMDLAEVGIDSVSEYVDNDARARWFDQVLEQAGAGAGIGADSITRLMANQRRERRLSDAVEDFEPEDSEGLLGLSQRNQWLLALSFLVCVVGVANAMLMSVTERFTEIATMKCLGAMDRFVMMMFVFEAIIQGAVGGVAGLLLGGLLAVARAWVDFGSLVGGASGAVGDVGLAMLTSLGAGILLAALAAVGPSWLASRLAPMEAMRVE